MKTLLLSAVAGAALMLGSIPTATAQNAVPTAAEAKAFVDKAEADLAQFSVYANRVFWTQNTYLNPDTNWLAAKVGAEGTDLSVKYAKEAARFDRTDADPATRRKLMILKQGLTLPAPDTPGASQKLADIQSRLADRYSTGKVTIDGKTYSSDETEELMKTTQDPAKLRAVWEGWHAVAAPMKGEYAELVGIANEGSRQLGYADTGALWRSGYDMEPDAFAAKTDKLWAQVEPFYKNLHCYVRGKLNAKYGDAVQPKTGPIRADLLGNMWAQEWGNVYPLVAPKDSPASPDLTQILVSHDYDTTRMFKTAEGFYTSLGFAPMPKTFWERSMLSRPRDREVVCYASAWDIDNKDDIRIKMCTKVGADDFFVVHHEMGHNIYQRAYQNQPYLFADGANDGFHEAIGDFAGLNALTPTYLKQIGLIDEVPGPEADIPLLLRRSLDSIGFLPFGLLVDRWCWQVFSGQVTPEHYNDAWWALRLKYQGVAPPGPRPADAFDPGAKFHVANNVPYTRYFLARIYEFQFYRAACRQAGWKGPLNRCSVYNNKEVGQKFAAMLEMGKSKPWPEALAAFTGEKDIDASAITEYFAPLNVWLTKQNKGQSCGW
ncbi:MAG: M2 family metallopeptidase [Caulobacteraceae bacterium]